MVKVILSGHSRKIIKCYKSLYNADMLNLVLSLSDHFCNNVGLMQDEVFSPILFH